MMKLIATTLVETERLIEKPNRCVSMLDDFMNCTIAMIKKREINMLAYPAGISVLNRLKTFPTKYDDGMMQRKAEKIKRYYEQYM